MFICVIKNEVQENHIQDYIKVTKQFADEIKNIPGCIKTIVLQDMVNKNVVVNVEIWDSQESKEKDSGNIFKKYKPELKKYFLSNQTETYTIQ